MKKKALMIALLIAVMSLTACGEQKTKDKLVNTETEIATETETVVETENETKIATEEVETEIESVEEATETETKVAESETSAEPEKEQYTYSDMDGTKYATTNANVRDLPDTVGAKITSLAYNKEVTVTGVCNETGWFRVDVSGKTGYVSSKYLSDTKAVEKVAEKIVTEQSASNNGCSAIETKPSSNRTYVKTVLVYLDDGNGNYAIPYNLDVYSDDIVDNEDDAGRDCENFSVNK